LLEQSGHGSTYETSSVPINPVSWYNVLLSSGYGWLTPMKIGTPSSLASLEPLDPYGRFGGIPPTLNWPACAPLGFYGLPKQHQPFIKRLSGWEDSFIRLIMEVGIGK
jgi:hypothetical protein